MNFFESIETAHYLHCPLKLTVGISEISKVVEVGDSFTIICSLLQGYPLPDIAEEEVTWFFLPANGTKWSLLHDDKHVTMVTRQYETRLSVGNRLSVESRESVGNRFTVVESRLSVVNALPTHQGTYQCRMRNFFGHRFGDSKMTSVMVQKTPTKNNTMKEEKLIFIVCCGGIFAIAVLCIIIRYYRTQKHGSADRKDKSMPTVSRRTNEISSPSDDKPCSTPTNTRKFYISHCTRDEKRKQQLLCFVKDMETKSEEVSFMLDLRHEQDINSAGGLSQWVPEQMLRAEKILVVLSEEYVEALDDSSPGVKDEGSLKVRLEYQIIQNHLFERCKMNDGKLILLRLSDCGGCGGCGGCSGCSPISLFKGRTQHLINLTSKDVSKSDFLFSVLRS